MNVRYNNGNFIFPEMKESERSFRMRKAGTMMMGMSMCMWSMHGL